MNRDDFIRELLAAAREAGIEAAEVYLQDQSSMRVLVREGAIDEYTVASSGGLSLRGLIDDKMGSAYSEALDRDAVVMLIRGVLESAVLINDKDPQTIFAGSPAYRTVDAGGNLGEAADRIDLAMALDRLGRAADPRIADLSAALLQTQRSYVRIVNSSGLDLSHGAAHATAYIGTIARQGDRTVTGGAVWVRANLNALDAGAIAREAADDATAQLDAAPVESGVYQIIVRHTAMEDLLGAFLGVFSAEAAQKGLSRLDGREGESTCAPCVTLIDDPLLAGGLYSRGFDAEGVATFAKPLIEGGTLKTLLHNLKTAAKAGVQSTGNAARAGYAGPVQVAPSNLLLMPGQRDLHGLEAAMGDGLVITEVEGLHSGTNPVSGDFSLLCRGYLVSGGRRGRAVEQVTVAGNIYTLLESVREIGADARPQTGHLVCPSAWVGALSIAGR